MLRSAIAIVTFVILLSGLAAAQAGILVTVDKSTQRLTVEVDGATRYQWPVSTARWGYSTPNGTYRPQWLARKWFSTIYDGSPMPYSIFFTDTGVAVHGTYEQRSLGRAVSHGCVRLSVKNAATLWNLVKQEKMANTSVVVTGDIPAAGSSVATGSRPMPLSSSNQRYRSLPPPFFIFGR